MLGIRIPDLKDCWYSANYRTLTSSMDIGKEVLERFLELLFPSLFLRKLSKDGNLPVISLKPFNRK
jgi:hypothetical protein